MDKLLELKSSFKDTTKYMTFIFVAIILIGAYVVQRSYMAVFLSDSLTSDFISTTQHSQQQSQVVTNGLTFSYGAMNMFWPIIIFLLYSTGFYFIRKQSNILVLS